MYEKVNKRMTMDGFLNKIKQADNVLFKYKWKANDITLPKYQEMREQLEENESWRELENLDVNKILPVLSYKRDKDLIEELLLAIRTGNLFLKDTELRYLKKGITEYYSTVEDVLTLIRIHKVD